MRRNRAAKPVIRMDSLGFLSSDIGDDVEAPFDEGFGVLHRQVLREPRCIYMHMHVSAR